MRKACFAISMAALASAAIIDRIAITVGKQVITEAQIEEEVRVTAFLNHKPLDLSDEQKKKAGERLIEQTLIKREMDFSGFDKPEEKQAEQIIADLAKTLGGEGKFGEELLRYGITPAILKEHVLWQIATMEFVDYRFRPAIQISDNQLQNYYKRKRAEWEKQDQKNIPSFDDSRDDLERALTAERVDQALDRWLGDTRTQVQIIYYHDALSGGGKVGTLK